MAFFISYPLSALGHDISPRAEKLHAMICLSYTSTDLYQNI